MMSRSKKEGPSPCRMKGRHLGRLDAGVRYRIEGVSWEPSGCELMERWRDIGITDRPDASRRLSASMDQKTAALTLTEERGGGCGNRAGAPSGSRCVLPCQETFRYHYSAGTRDYRKAMGRARSRFRGCQSLEDNLRDGGLLWHEPKEVLGRTQDYRLTQEGLENAQEPETEEQTHAREQNWEPKGPRAASFHQCEMDSLEDEDEEGDEDVDQASDSGLPALPKLAQERWVLYLEPHIDQLNLTYKQRSAVNLVILENHQGMTIGEAAKKLRISVDSLKDRIKQVEKKILALFPEAATIERPDGEGDKDAQKKEKKPKLDSDFAYGGFYRRSEARRVAPLYRVHPESGLRILIDPITDSPTKRRHLTEEERALRAQRLEEVQRVTYYPTHNGIFSPWVPVGPRKNVNSTVLIDASDYRRKVPHLRDYE